MSNYYIHPSETIEDTKVFQLDSTLEAMENRSPFLLLKSGDDIGNMPMDKYEFLTNEIDSFVTLNSNWDGYGASPALNEIGDSTKKLIAFLGPSLIERTTDIFPNPHGTISIEWENRNEEKLSLEIGVHNYSYFVKYNDKTPKLVNGENILSDLKNITADLGDLLRDEIPKYFL